MKRLFYGIIFINLLLPHLHANNNIEMEVVTQFSVNEEVGMLRALPVQIGKNETAILLVYSHDKDIDPYIEMFYPPTDQVKFALYSLEGELIWKKELGAGNINGGWFLPVYPFDLDNDGIDEIYYVNNTDSVHILSYKSLRLEALDSRTGNVLGQWPWKLGTGGEVRLSYLFRQFIFGGYVKGEPVLVTAQGTYGQMSLQAWTKGMESKWDLLITKEEAGARGSHQSPIVDINHDNIDEILWGERCISLDNGEYLFIADKEVYNGHSDVIQPTLNRETGEWYVFTCRESGSEGQIKPRVVMFDDKGERIWTDLDEGHMDMGWTAHVNTDSLSIVAFTISRGEKVAGPNGFFRLDVKEYVYNAITGERITLPFKAYCTVPTDIDGDGYHEFVSAIGEQGDRKIYTFSGEVVGDLGEKAVVAMACKFLNMPGEQLLSYYPDGTIKIWADKNAKDSKLAKERYNSGFYKLNVKLTSVGYNKTTLGGL